MKFFLNHNLIDAQVVLRQDVEALENSVAEPGAREDLMSTCALYSTACASFLFPCSSSSSSATPWFSEALLIPLLKAFALVGMKPKDLLQECDFRSGVLAKLSSKQYKNLAAVVKSVGFEEAKEM